MKTGIPLNEMTRKEKLIMMEKIWNDLLADEEDIPSPDWHRDILNHRMKAIDQEKPKIHEWDDVKSMLRDEFK